MFTEDGNPIYEGYCIDLIDKIAEVRKKIFVYYYYYEMIVGILIILSSLWQRLELLRKVGTKWLNIRFFLLLLYADLIV